MRPVVTLLPAQGLAFGAATSTGTQTGVGAPLAPALRVPAPSSQGVRCLQVPILRHLRDVSCKRR